MWVMIICYSFHMLCRNSQLGIAALVVLAHGDRRLSALEVASATGLSHPTVAKVLSSLRHGGFIISTPGPGGGFSLQRPSNKITILAICNYFENQTSLPVSCAIDCGCTGESPCAIHAALVQVEQLREKTLSDITIDHLGAA